MPPEKDAPLTDVQVVSVLEPGKKPALDFDFSTMARAINEFKGRPRCVAFALTSRAR